MEPGHLPLRRGAVCEVDLVDASVIQRGIRSDSDFSWVRSAACWHTVTENPALGVWGTARPDVTWGVVHDAQAYHWLSGGYRSDRRCVADVPGTGFPAVAARRRVDDWR